MDTLALLTRPGTYVLGLSIYVLTFLTRRVVEIVWPTLKKQADANAPGLTYLTPLSRWWNEVILYVIPVLLGALTALSDSAFLFEGIDGGARAMYAAGVGWFSSFIYKSIKRLARDKLDLKETVSEVTQ